MMQIKGQTTRSEVYTWPGRDLQTWVDALTELALLWGKGTESDVPERVTLHIDKDFDGAFQLKMEVGWQTRYD